MDVLAAESGIKSQVLEQIYELEKKYELETVILFGSRARGDFREKSDIDLAVLGEKTGQFRIALEEETDTLLKYDVINLNQDLEKNLRDNIEREGKLVYEKV